MKPLLASLRLSAALRGEFFGARNWPSGSGAKPRAGGRLPILDLVKREPCNLNVDSNLLCTLTHEFQVRDDDEIRAILYGRNCQAKFRADACRFAGSDDECFAGVGHIRMST